MTNDYGNHTQFLCLKLFDQGKTVFRQFSVIFRDLYTHIIKIGKYLSDTLNQKKDVLAFDYDHRNKKKYTKLLSNYHIIN